MSFRSNWKKLFGVVLVGVLALPVLGAMFWLVDPVRFRLAVFQPLREARLAVKELEPLNGWSTIRRVEVSPTREIRIEAITDDQVDIVADLWAPDAAHAAPAMLLLHGSAPWGRKAGLIQMLGTAFRERGWIALAPDARGFGDTGDPSALENPDAWAVAGDVRRALDVLVELPQVDETRVYVLGHSLGGNHALEGALNDPRIKGLLLIGPTRFLRGEETKTSRWQRTRLAADRRLRAPVSESVARAGRNRGDLALLAAGPLGVPQHTPILLLDGENEGRADLEFFRQVAEKIAPPLTYVTLPDTGHYCGVWNLFGSPTVYFQPETFERCFNTLHGYIADSGS